MAAIKNEVTLASREILKATNGQLSERIAGRFKVIIEQAEMLTLLFKRLTPFSGRRRGRPVQTTIEQLIKDSFGLYAQRIEELKVSVELPDGASHVTDRPVGNADDSCQSFGQFPVLARESPREGPQDFSSNATQRVRLEHCLFRQRSRRCRRCA